MVEYTQSKRLIVQYDIPCLPTYFSLAGIGTWLDVTFCSSGYPRLMTRLYVLDEKSGSDHKYISFTIGRGKGRKVSDFTLKLKTFGSLDNSLEVRGVSLIIFLRMFKRDFS